MILKKMIPLLLLTLLFACGNRVIVDPFDSFGTAEDLKMGMSAFSGDYFEAILDDDENLLVSPLSLQTALYMATNGAGGNTLEEMKTVLGISPMNVLGLNSEYQKLEESFVSAAPETKLSLSNSVWHDDQMSLEEVFRIQMEEVFKAEVINKDFSAQETVDDINNWANEKTEGKIKKVLEQISNDEVLFLINALYFIGDWKEGFAEDLTMNRPFNLNGGGEVDVPMMNVTGMRSAYLGEDYSAVDLSFKGDEYSMTFILPKEGVSPSAFASENDMASLLTDLYDTQLQTSHIVLSLPKFEIANKHQLKDLLIGLGMKDAFSKSSADFSFLGSAGGNLFITKVIQDSYLKIDEKGAEGAAVTTIGVGVTSLPQPVEFNRPFLFTIRHIESGAMVFMGSVQNPLEN